MSLSQQLGPLNLEQRITQFQKFLSERKPNYYEMFEVSKTATVRDIDSAFRLYSNLFPQDQVSNIRDEKTRQKANSILSSLRQAYDVLTHLEKRAAYEKRGFRSADEMEESEDTPIEKAKLYCRKAKTLQAKKDFSTAIRALKEAIALDPNTGSYYFLLGLCQAEIPMMIQDAEKSLQKAADMEAWNAEPLAALGMLFYKARMYKRAEGYFRKVLALEPSHPVASKKLEELVGPQKNALLVSLGNAMAPLKKGLAKVLPTLFGEKKK